jgi:hypothetical protein
VSKQLTTFLWSTSFFTGTSQLNEGPFNIGDVHKIFRAEVHGMVNFEGTDLGLASVLANVGVWGLQWGAAGYTARDIISDPDSDGWLMRQQFGATDTIVGWSPQTADAAVLHSYVITNKWAGQLDLGGANTDCYLVFEGHTAGLDNLNTFGSIRLWWI